MEAKPKYTILIVDDEESTLNSLRGVFSREEYDVILAGSGREGLARLRERKIRRLL